MEEGLHHQKTRRHVQPAEFSEEDSEADSEVDSREPEKARVVVMPVEMVDDAVAQPLRHRCRLVGNGVFCSVSAEAASAEVEGVPVKVSVDDQLEVAKEEVAARGNHPGIVVGEEAVEVDDHAGDEAEALPLLRHRTL